MKKQISSEEAMKEFGEQIGRLVEGGEVIELIGDIGAGKTTLTKGLAVGMEISETVQSPTFTINRVYSATNHRLLAHYDFYRLADAGIMADELHETAREPGAVVVVEWGDVVRAVLPEDHLQIVFASPSETDRELVMSAHGPRSERLLGELD